MTREGARALGLQDETGTVTRRQGGGPLRLADRAAGGALLLDRPAGAGEADLRRRGRLIRALANPFPFVSSEARDTLALTLLDFARSERVCVETMMHARRDNSRHIAAPTGTELSCQSWTTEAAMRMLMNNLDPQVAEAPEDLVVYGGIGRAARDWESYDAIVSMPEASRRGRDPAGPVGQAGRRLPHPQGRAARPDRQFQPGAALGDLGPFQRTRSQGPDDVRPDDGRLLDLHRHPGHRSGHLRDLRRDGPPALWRRPQGQMDPDRRPRRHGRRAAAGGGDGRGALHRHRMPGEPHRRSGWRPAISTGARPASTRRWR